MQAALEHLSKEDLLKVISSRDAALSEQQRMVDSLTYDSAQKDEKIEYLESQLAMYRRMQFGQKRERFEGDPNQGVLPFDAEPTEKQQQQEEIKEKIEYTRTRPNHKGRAKLPDHLPVEEIEIHPEGDLSDKVCIGRETTDVLDYMPGYFKIKRYIRYKYATKDKDNTQISIGLLPE